MSVSQRHVRIRRMLRPHGPGLPVRTAVLFGLSIASLLWLGATWQPWVVEFTLDAGDGKRQGLVRAWPERGLILTQTKSDNHLETLMRIWRSSDGKCLDKFTDEFLEFSPDGAYFVSMRRDRVGKYALTWTTHVWETSSGREVAQCSEHYACFSPDGSRVVTLPSRAHTVVRDSDSGEVIVSLEERFRGYSPDAAYMLTENTDCETVVRDARTLALVAELDGWFKGYGGGGGGLVTTPRPSVTRLWAAEGFEEHGRFDEKFLCFAAHVPRFVTVSEKSSPDGSTLLGYILRIRDSRSGTLEREFEHRHNVSNAEFSADGSHLKVLLSSRKEHVWDTRSGEESSFRDFSCNEPGNWGLAGERLPPGTWRPASKRYQHDHQRDPDASPRIWKESEGLLFAEESPDGQVAITASRVADPWLRRACVIKGWDRDAKKPSVLSLDERFIPWAVTFSGDSSRCVVLFAEPGGPGALEIRLWQTATWRLLAATKLTGPWSTVFFPDGDRILLESGPRARILDGHTLETLAELPGTYAQPFGGWDRMLLAETPDGLCMIRRRRPEWWWGVAWLPAFWVTLVALSVLAWSGRRDMKRLRASTHEPAPASQTHG